MHNCGAIWGPSLSLAASLGLGGQDDSSGSEDMSAIRKFFLHARAWQVFFIVVGSYFTGQYLLPQNTSHQTYALAVLAAICMSGVFGWLWLLGTSLNSVVRLKYRESTRLLTLAVFVSTSYLVALSISGKNPRVLYVLVPLTVVTFVSVIYLLDFVARSLVLAETGKAPTVRRYIRPLFLLAFFPLGIWFVQPRINRLFAESRERSA